MIDKTMVAIVVFNLAWYALAVWGYFTYLSRKEDKDMEERYQRDLAIKRKYAEANLDKLGVNDNQGTSMDNVPVYSISAEKMGFKS